MKAKRDPIGARRSRWTALALAIALFGTLFLFQLPGRAAAAVIPDPGVDLSVFCGIGFAGDCAPRAEGRPDGFSPLDFGIALWNDAAASLEAPVLAPIPLPAAGWLLLAGLGALGLAQRRRQARSGDALLRHGLRSHGAVLRLGARTDLLEAAAVHLRRRVRTHLVLADPFGPAAPGSAVRAFALGEASPVRPCGGAGHRYPATAERAPPAPAAAVCRNDDGVQTSLFPFKPPRLTVSPPVAWRFPFEPPAYRIIGAIDQS